VRLYYADTKSLLRILLLLYLKERGNKLHTKAATFAVCKCFLGLTNNVSVTVFGKMKILTEKKEKKTFSTER
jgi:hypothetical protein